MSNIIKVKDTNGNWVGIPALQGANGITPSIGPNGNWFIGMEDTGVKAEGLTELPVASADTLGAIKVGKNLNIDENGVLNGNDVDLTSYATTEYVDNGIQNLMPVNTIIIPNRITITETETPIRSIFPSFLDAGGNIYFAPQGINFLGMSSYESAWISVFAYAPNVWYEISGFGYNSVSGNIDTGTGSNGTSAGDANMANGILECFTISYDDTTGQWYNLKVYDYVNTGNVLTKDNHSEYTPTLDYHPATKKYVDDSISAIDIDGEHKVYTIIDTTSEYVSDALPKMLDTFGQILADYLTGKQISVIINIQCDMEGHNGLYVVTNSTNEETLYLEQVNKNLGLNSGNNMSTIGEDYYIITAHVGEGIIPTASWDNGFIASAEGAYLATDVEYETPYEPLYAGSPATKKYVDDVVSNIQTQIDAKAGQPATYTATIPTSGWTASAPYYVDVTVTGILATDNPSITVTYSGTLSTDQTRKENWNKIDRIETYANKIRVYAFDEVPTTTIPIQIVVIR